MWEQNAQFVYHLLGIEYKKYKQSGAQTPTEQLLQLQGVAEQTVHAICEVRIDARNGNGFGATQWGHRVETLAEQAATIYDSMQKEQEG